MTALSTCASCLTGKERDSESGLDYFGARYYSSTMGRFMSPDWSDSPDSVPYADFENPQSLNLYAYVNNNPLSLVDSDGHTHQECSKSSSSSTDADGTIHVTVTEYCANVPDWYNFGTRFMNWRQQQADAWNARIAANRPPPQPQNQNITAEDILNMAINLPGIGSQLMRRDRLKHILEGDKTGGGHRPGTGISGKTEFPAGWDDNKIAEAIADVATNPNAEVVVQGSDKVMTGTVDGVQIKVVVRNGEIWAAHPTNLPRNP